MIKNEDNELEMARRYCLTRKSYFKDKKTSIATIDAYYKKYKTEANQRFLEKNCLYEKTGFAKANGDYKQCNAFCDEIISKGLVDSDIEASMIDLSKCENYISLGDNKAAIQLIDNNMDDSRSWDVIDFLLLYAQITDDDIIHEPYLSSLSKTLERRGYHGKYPDTYTQLKVLHELLCKEARQRGKILSIEDQAEQKAAFEEFKKTTHFDHLKEY